MFIVVGVGCQSTTKQQQRAHPPTNLDTRFGNRTSANTKSNRSVCSDKNADRLGHDLDSQTQSERSNVRY